MRVFSGSAFHGSANETGQIRFPTGKCRGCFNRSRRSAVRSNVQAICARADNAMTIGTSPLNFQFIA
jgi:hypothetical protein